MHLYIKHNDKIILKYFGNDVDFNIRTLNKKNIKEPLISVKSHDGFILYSFEVEKESFSTYIKVFNDNGSLLIEENIDGVIW
jgi:hypothetical protein